MKIETQTMDVEYYMGEALLEAQKAYLIEEVPIGAVIVQKDEIIARAFNRRNTMKSPLCHAEMEAIHKAALIAGDWRLEECTIFVTVEPCPMCAGAILQARIPHVVFGAPNAKAGCAGSIFNLLDEPAFNHRCQITQGVRLEECSALMQAFFKEFRLRAKQEKNTNKK